MKPVRMAVPALIFMALGLALIGCEGGEGEGFPSFVYASGVSLESYRAASSLPTEVIASIPCYCGCGTMDPPHTSLQDCFFAPDGGYSDHAATCDLCDKIVLDVEAEFQGGGTLAEIRDLVDSTYSVYGNPTDTPPVGEDG